MSYGNRIWNRKEEKYIYPFMLQLGWNVTNVTEVQSDSQGQVSVTAVTDKISCHSLTASTVSAVLTLTACGSHDRPVTDHLSEIW